MKDSKAKLILKIIVAFILPPAAAYWQVQFTLHFWINVILILIGWLPATAHAVWLILREKYPELNVDVPKAGQQA